MESEVIERFLRYAAIDTGSVEDAEGFPSTEKQKDLGRLLAKELSEMGAEDVFFDEENGYVYAHLSASEGVTGDGKTLAFLAHMDTSPEVSGKNVRPQLVRDYDGGDIVLDSENGVILSPLEFPELKNYIGKTLITTDGTTLLGSDDKSGIAEIMTMVSTLLSHPERKHGRIAVCFTPDEEVGRGVDRIDLKRLDADYAYTVDGGALGELEYENFNAASVKVHIQGVSVHPGEAKGKMKNASLIAQELTQMLPEKERPENTSGYEGFYHLTGMRGSVEGAELSFIIRDHDRVKFENKKKVMEAAATKLNEKYGEGTISVSIEDSYYNMREKIEPDYLFLIQRAEEAMKAVGIEPKVQPIRGGTDGARLSYMGLPCPNLCAGGHNFHGRYEYVPAESMEKIVELLLKLCL